MSNQIARFDEEPEETVGLYGDERYYPNDYSTEDVIYKCPNCASKNTGYEEKAASLLTVVASVLSLLIFRLYAFLILPLVIESTKTITKKCLKCEHILDKQELLSISSLTDKVLSFKCGSCAIVISRKYALVILALMMGLWFFLPSHETEVNPGGLNLELTRWEEFVEDCGKKVVLNNQVRAKRVFDQKYAQNIVTWSGVFFQNIPRNMIPDPMIGRVILIKMNPSDSVSSLPDIQLVFSYGSANKYHTVLDVLQEGDVIEFKGVIRALGDEFKYHNVEAMRIERTGERMEIAKIPTMSYSGNVNNKLRKGLGSQPVEGEGQKSDRAIQNNPPPTAQDTPQPTAQETPQEVPQNTNNANDAQGDNQNADGKQDGQDTQGKDAANPDGDTSVVQDN